MGLFYISKKRKIKVIDNTHIRFCIIEHIDNQYKESFLWADIINNTHPNLDFILIEELQEVL
jgi:hypothetical protein